ncbi:hypothetical protein BAE44_0015147 [Dichanthelium oligosanthes]|uniref:SMP-LTD domain-containing protein n=1 Tax=Dichanthelium oligosanthes TaxID=888268 RepID=A0A1E5VFC7_9POAL|nr:hypothetical protein BAE44_0015147 [Dichanthelium oligosanthes]
MAAVALLLLGFLLGLLSLAIAEGAALLWAIRSLTRRNPSSPGGTAPPPPLGELKRQGFLWMLEQEKTPKVTINRPSNGASHGGIKEKKTIVEVFPVKMLAKLQGHSLTLSAPDGSQQTVHLLNCTVVAVSASNLPSRKWAKRYPIKLESKESEICRGSKVCYVYADTSWEKESWCKALRLASTTDKDKLKFHAMLTEEFQGYISSLNAGYPCFLKPSMLSGQEHVVVDNTVKTDGSSKLRSFLKRLAKKASIKASPESKTSLVLSTQEIKPPSTPSSSVSFNSQLSDNPHANDGTLCWNLLFSRLFFDAKMNDELNKAIKAGIQRTLSNTRTPAYIGELTLAGLSLGKLPPYLHRMRVLPLDLNELWAFEVDFEYSSGMLLHIETRLEVREPELEKDMTRTGLKDDSNGDVSLDVLDSIEQYGNQFRSSEALDSAVEDNDEADALRKSKSTGWTSTYMSRWKSILHSIADQVSQDALTCTALSRFPCKKMPLSLAIKVSCVRGTMRVHIKPPPSDRICAFGWCPTYIQASLHQSLVLPNCESIPISWMISDKDDWVARKMAPFIWLNREPPETNARSPAGTARELPGEASVSKAIVKNKSSPPSMRSKNISPKKTKICVDGLEQAEASTSWQSRLVSASGAPLQSSEDATTDQLRMPLLSSSRDESAVVLAAGTSAAAGEEAGDVKRKRSGRRARVMDLGRRMGGTLEEKGKHIVGKMRENARSNNLLLPDLAPAPAAPN